MPGIRTTRCSFRWERRRRTAGHHLGGRAALRPQAHRRGAGGAGRGRRPRRVRAESAQEAAADARHHAGLEELLAVSSRLTESRSIDVLLAGVGDGIQRALGSPRSASIWSTRWTACSRCATRPAGGSSRCRPARRCRWRPSSDCSTRSSATRAATCSTAESALLRLASDRQVHASERNGAGRWRGTATGCWCRCRQRRRAVGRHLGGRSPRTG